MRLFFRDYKNFRECENCLTSPKPHQEEMRRAFSQKSLKPFIFCFGHSSILSFQILETQRDIPKAGNNYPKTLFVCFFPYLNNVTSILLLTLDLSKVQGLELYLNAESLWMLVEVFLCCSLACLQNPIYCSSISVDIRRWFLN